MSYTVLSNARVLEVAVRVSRPDALPAKAGLPDEVRAFLARLRLLEGVPFSHLVADAELLPPESIRFFYVDREWTDALVEGALAVSTITTLDREQLQTSYPLVRDDVDAEERRIRTDETQPLSNAPANTITGFLLRSAAVSGWPGLHVRAYREEVPDDAVIAESDRRRLRLLRLERLAPAVLLALFDGVPAIVHVEEPRQGIQFGVDLRAAQGGTGASIRARDANTAKVVPNTRIDVPFRAGAPGVVHVAQLAAAIAAAPATHVTTNANAAVTSSEVAMQLLQFPYRQAFGPDQKGVVEADFDAAFRPTVGLAGTLKRLGGER